MGLNAQTANFTHLLAMAIVVLANVRSVSIKSQAAEPTSDEQHLIELVNRARHNPPKYATDFGLSVPLTDASHQPPLALNTALVGSARFHAQEMAAQNYFGHQSAVTGDWPNKMAKDSGYPLPAFWELNNNFIESIAAGTTSPTQTLNLLLIDEGIDPPGHRIHLLAMHPFFASHDEIGAGHGFNASSTYRNYWAIHTALDDDPRKFVTGVVYNDTTIADHFYTAGEGLAGVTVEALAPGTNTVVASTTSFASGGYSLKLSSGLYDIRFTGGPIAHTVTHKFVAVGPDHAKVDTISLWNQDGNGAWNSTANWFGGVPDGVGTIASVYGPTAAARTVNLGQATVGQLRFQNAGGLTITGDSNSRLDFDVACGAAALSVIGPGEHSISTAVHFHDDTTVSIDAGASLSFAGAELHNEGKTLTKTGPGILNLGGELSFERGSTFLATGGITNINSDLASDSERPPSLAVSNPATQVFLNSSQYLDSLVIDGGRVTLTPGGNKVLALKSLSIASSPPAGLSVAVPEPASLGLLITAMTLALCRKMSMRRLGT